MNLEKTKEEKIKFLRNWIAENGTTEDTKRLLYELEHNNILYVHLIPREIFHDLYGSNVSPIPLNLVPKYQIAYPEYNWNALAIRGAAVVSAKTLERLEKALA